MVDSPPTEDCIIMGLELLSDTEKKKKKGPKKLHNFESQDCSTMRAVADTGGFPELLCLGIIHSALWMWIKRPGYPPGACTVCVIWTLSPGRINPRQLKRLYIKTWSQMLIRELESVCVPHCDFSQVDLFDAKEKVWDRNSKQLVLFILQKGS